MERKDIEKCIYNALQPDPVIRKHSEEAILKMQETDYEQFIVQMVEIFTDKNSDYQKKLISGVITKNSLYSTESSIQKKLETRWLNININSRERIKSMLISSFDETNEKISTLIGSVLGLIAVIEVPRSIYMDFFDIMASLLTDEQKICAVMEAVGTCCKSIYDDYGVKLSFFATKILFICTCKLEDQKSSRKSKDYSLKCLINTMESLDVLFNEDTKVNYIFNCLFLTAQCDEDLAYKSLICINRFVRLYSSKIKTKLQEISAGINKFSGSENNDVVVNVLEFWNIICEVNEEEILERNFEILLPFILKSLFKLSDIDDQTWTPHKAAASLLESINEIFKNKLLFNPVMFKFLETQLQSTDLLNINVGAIALGCCISENCERQLVNFVKILIFNMKNSKVEESCLWAISRISELNFFAVVEHLNTLLGHTCEIITKQSPNSNSAAWILTCIFKSIHKYRRSLSLSEDIDLATQKKMIDFAYDQINTNFKYILQILINATENAKLEDSILRVALFAALSELVKIIDESNSNVIDEFLNYSIGKINECVIAVNKASSNYIPIIEDVLSNYVVLSEVIANKRKKNSGHLLINSYFSVLDSKPTTSIGEVYIAMTNNIELFISYSNNLLKYLSRDLKCLDEFILKSSINLVGTLATQMEHEFLDLSVKVLPMLVHCLSSKDSPKSVKPYILSVFGDIALALGPQFTPYVEMASIVLHQVLELDRKSDIKYADCLRKNAIQMIDCVLIASGDSNALRKNLEQIIDDIRKIVMDDCSDDCLLVYLNVLYDVKCMYGNNYGLDGAWIGEFLDKAYKAENQDIQMKARKLYDQVNLA